MPAWAASTSSSTTPIRVTATPATASTLPIQPSERSCLRLRRNGRQVAGEHVGAAARTALGTAASTAPQVGRKAWTLWLRAAG